MYYLADFETPKNSREYLRNKKTYDTTRRAEKYLNSDLPEKEASRIWKLKGLPSRFAEEGEGSMGAYVDLQNKIKKRVEQIKPEVFKKNKESFKDNYQWRLDKKVTKKHAKRTKAKTAKTFNVTRRARNIVDTKLAKGVNDTINAFAEATKILYTPQPKVVTTNTPHQSVSKVSEKIKEVVTKSPTTKATMGLGKKALLGTAGLAGLGAITYGVNKLRKTRNDKGKIRGKYRI